MRHLRHIRTDISSCSFYKEIDWKKKVILTLSAHDISDFSVVFFCMFNSYMPTFNSHKLHLDLCILLDQEMLKLIFTNTLKQFSSLAAHAYKIVQNSKFTSTGKTKKKRYSVIKIKLINALQRQAKIYFNFLFFMNLTRFVCSMI